MVGVCATLRDEPTEHVDEATASTADLPRATAGNTASSPIGSPVWSDVDEILVLDRGKIVSGAGTPI
jgi:hypothetical protein